MDGILIVNKPKGCTSHDVVAEIRKMLDIKKVGHTGTLDPNATGVLPLLLNKGTQISKYLIEHDKEYEVTLKLGTITDTLDSEGNILEEKEVKEEILEKTNIEKVINSFIGKQEQIPPIYSAIKVNGKKLYEYARKGESIKIEPRKIEIYNINLLKIDKKEKQIIFKVECSKGTYIRSLCKDIAERLGTIGYMKELKRVKVGKFKIQDAVTLEDLKNNIKNEEYINEKIITIEEFFKDYEKIELSENKLNHFLNGVKISINKEEGLYNIYSNKKYIGIGIANKNLLKRDIIL